MTIKAEIVVDGGNLLGEGVVWSPSHDQVQWVDITGKKFCTYRPATGAAGASSSSSVATTTTTGIGGATASSSAMMTTGSVGGSTSSSSGVMSTGTSCMPCNDAGVIDGAGGDPHTRLLCCP